MRDIKELASLGNSASSITSGGAPQTHSLWNWWKLFLMKWLMSLELILNAYIKWKTLIQEIYSNLVRTATGFCGFWTRTHSLLPLAAQWGINSIPSRPVQPRTHTSAFLPLRNLPGAEANSRAWEGGRGSLLSPRPQVWYRRLRRPDHPCPSSRGGGFIPRGKQAHPGLLPAPAPHPAATQALGS